MSHWRIMEVEWAGLDRTAGRVLRLDGSGLVGVSWRRKGRDWVRWDCQEYPLVCTGWVDWEGYVLWVGLVRPGGPVLCSRLATDCSQDHGRVLSALSARQSHVLFSVGVLGWFLWVAITVSKPPGEEEEGSVGIVTVSGLGPHGDGDGCASGPALCPPPPGGAASHAPCPPPGLASGAASCPWQGGAGRPPPPPPLQE